MGQHLDFHKNNNVPRRHLEEKNIDPKTCSFRLVAHGPILKEAKTNDQHKKRRDSIATMEKALADEVTSFLFGSLKT